VFARTGYKRDFFLVGQWFPKIAVYEPAGLRGRAAGGWNCHQFHANSEFYADYGRFRVAMTVPSRFVLGATGPRVDTRKNADGTTTYVHEQRDVHDFAWTADPKFVEVKDTFSADRDVTPAEYEAAAKLVDRPLAEVRLRDVAITLLLQPAHLPQARRHIQAAKNGLKYFGLWYGAYPYPTLTVVDPGVGAMGAGGMEYPTFITAGTSFLFNRWPLDRIRLPEEVTIHEFGHQYWYGLVGSNEFEESWLDEGFNTYSTHKVDAVSYPAMLELFGFRFFAQEEERLGNGLARRFRPHPHARLGLLAGQYSFNSYSRPALLLGTLEAMLGEPTMARIMRTYHERFPLRPSVLDDFFAVASEVSGRDLRDFFRQVVEGPGLLDDAVTDVYSDRVPADRGVLEGPEGRPDRDRARRGEGRQGGCALSQHGRAAAAWARSTCLSRSRCGSTAVRRPRSGPSRRARAGRGGATSARRRSSRPSWPRGRSTWIGSTTGGVPSPTRARPRAGALPCCSSSSRRSRSWGCEPMFLKTRSAGSRAASASAVWRRCSGC
jgi:hypothetical protein